jgi:hypothetical protein
MSLDYFEKMLARDSKAMAKGGVVTTYGESICIEPIDADKILQNVINYGHCLYSWDANGKMIDYTNVYLIPPEE